jgi:hypothetical protein
MRVRRFDDIRRAIAEEKHRYTTKCFEGFDKIRLTLGYIGLTAVVGVWVITCWLAQLL